jgi:hypothetical protein
MAQEIETLNEGMQSDERYRSLTELLRLYGLSASFLPERGRLPGRLRFYAGYLDLLDCLRSTLRHSGRSERVSLARKELTDAVWAASGKSHSANLALLLNAAYQAVGLDLDVDPKALDMHRSRRLSQNHLK